MGLHTDTPSPLEHHSDGGIRKRVCKACDRCRLKKSKCDGSSPCSRCKADNTICVFGERKKSHDKVYPKGYVEMLEQQQAQLVTGLQVLYKRVLNGQGWVGSPLSESNNGNPLTHDILEHLGALKQEGHSGSEVFEEDPNVIKHRLFANGAAVMQGPDSDVSTSPESPTLESIPGSTSPYTDPWTSYNLGVPRTPPDNSQMTSYPYATQQPPQSSLKVQQYNQPMPVLNPAMLQQPNWMYEENAGSMMLPGEFEMPGGGNFLSSPRPVSTITPSCQPILDSNWNEDETFQTFFNPTPV